MVPNHAALVFLKAPEAGMVKTRLAKDLGNKQALELYKQFVRDILAMLKETGVPLEIFFHPREKAGMVKNWLGSQYSYHPQSGRNLGEKMANAFTRAFENGRDRAVLIGTDIPDLPGDIVRDALDLLQTSRAVIGPAADGGYYLIGFQARGFVPAVFDGIPWGTDSVYARTLGAFRKHQSPVHRMPQWHDVDEYQDLKAFIRRNAAGKTRARHTMAFITRNIPSLVDNPNEEEGNGNILQP